MMSISNNKQPGETTMEKKLIKGGLLLIVLSMCLFGCSQKEVQKKTQKNTTTEKQKIQRRQIKKSNLIIELDPGHGGNDSGATDGSESRLQEKDINLKIAKYIQEELSDQSNIKVYLTRNSDTKTDLSNRVTKAVKDKADLFISIHNNAKGEIVDYDHGCTVIVPTGNYNKAISKKAQILGCQFLKYLGKTGITDQGLLMRTSENNQRYPNGQLKDYYAVIRQSVEQKIPGVIVEHAFVDHKEDARQFLSDDTKIRKLARADAKAIKDYCFGNEKQEKTEKVILVTDEKGSHNKYFEKKFVLYESK